MEKDLQVVGFRIGNETYGVRISAVREIVRVPEITAVPSAPDIIEGVINLRGKIIPVMDLRKRFGQVYTVADKKNRILVVGSVFADGESGYVTGVGKLKGRLIILLDITKLMYRRDLRSLEAAAESLATASK